MIKLSMGGLHGKVERVERFIREKRVGVPSQQNEDKNLPGGTPRNLLQKRGMKPRHHNLRGGKKGF